MDPSSFQYNTAIEQITKQEQGEASAMSGVLYGCYALQSYPLGWGWIATFLMLFSTPVICIALFVGSVWIIEQKISH